MTGIIVGSLYALLALGYTLVYGILQLINFAHADVFMWGTFAGVWVLLAFGADGRMTLAAAAGWLVLAAIAATLVSGTLAVGVERVAYRRLIRKRASGIIVLISAIGASLVLSETIGLRDRIAGLFGLKEVLAPYVDSARTGTAFPIEIEKTTMFTIGSQNILDTEIVSVAAAVIMMIALDLFVRRTSFGRQMRAVSQDREAAQLMGTNTTRVVQITFLIGGVMAGVAATLYMMRIGYTSYDVGALLGIKAFTAAVLGGIGNLRGAFFGGLILGLVEAYASVLIGNQWKDVTAFVVLVLVLLVRPLGLFGQALGRSRV